MHKVQGNPWPSSWRSEQSWNHKSSPSASAPGAVRLKFLHQPPPAGLSGPRQGAARCAAALRRATAAAGWSSRNPPSPRGPRQPPAASPSWRAAPGGLRGGSEETLEIKVWILHYNIKVSSAKKKQRPINKKPQCFRFSCKWCNQSLCYCQQGASFLARNKSSLLWPFGFTVSAPSWSTRAPPRDWLVPIPFQMWPKWLKIPNSL